MNDDLSAEAATTSRTFGVAMILGSIAVAVVGMTFIVSPAGWWSYATGAIALIGAALLAYFGVKQVSKKTK